MGDTSLTVDADTKQRLSDDYRSPEHDSWTEFFNGLMEMLPTREEMEECSYGDCDRNLWRSGPVEDWGGVIQWFAAEHNGSTIYGNAYFCSPEHAEAAQEEVRQMVPTNPALVRVGGHEELSTEFTGAEYYLDGEHKELSIPMPGAFGGSDSHGNDYDYTGEPVYLQNDRGEWVASAVVDEIIHEEAHTALILGSNLSVEKGHHPDADAESEA